MQALEYCLIIIVSCTGTLLSTSPCLHLHVTSQIFSPFALKVRLEGVTYITATSFSFS